MRVKYAALSAIGFWVFALVQTVVAAQSVATCELPQDLRREITAKYPGAKIVGLSDLSDDNKEIFQEDHRDKYPGLVKVDFYGDRKPTWALVLLSGNEATEKAELFVAHQIGKDWSIVSLETSKSSVPVVWTQGPGTYRDVYGEKTIRARRPVIVFGEYAGWIIVYSWTGRKVDKIWLVD